jgi:2-(1,2-epoxy-1,2-dihydrophenyl)acetyl-CoA isomerase
MPTTSDEAAPPSLRIERDAGVVTLTLSRPERRNAIDIPLWHALTRALREIGERGDDRALVLTGDGGTFCAGGDLSGSAGGSGGGASGAGGGDPLEAATRTLRETVGAACLALHELPKPTIAAVEGTAAGAGANLAFGCDLVVAARDARFGEVFVRRALPLDSGGSWLLPRLVGLQRAKQLAFFGDWLDATEACRIGLVTRVVDGGGAKAQAQAWAQQLAASSPDALACIKRDLNLGLSRSFDQALEAEARSLAECATKPAFAEAVAAFRKSR